MKLSIEEIDKQRVCERCGWVGVIGQTIGPHQERMFESEIDDKIFWKVSNYFYCPNCFDQSTKQGSPVATFVWKGRVK